MLSLGKKLSTDKWIIEKRVIKSWNKFISAESHHKFVTVKYCDFFAVGQPSRHPSWFRLVGWLQRGGDPPLHWWRRLRRWTVSRLCISSVSYRLRSAPSFILLPTIHTDIYGHNKIYFKQCRWSVPQLRLCYLPVRGVGRLSPRGGRGIGYSSQVLKCSWPLRGDETMITVSSPMDQWHPLGSVVLMVLWHTERFHNQMGQGWEG